MLDAVLLDFYGTVVHEDDVVIDQISTTIGGSAATPATASEVRRHWSQAFAATIEASHGDRFRTQRSIELATLARTIDHFGARCDARELCRPLFDFWQSPPALDDALAFIGAVDVPIIVVSNIDRDDIEAALDHHRLTFDAVITSEDVRSYKPRPEPFIAGLHAPGATADRVLHIGDSLARDVRGAQRLGIPVVWVNRRGKPSPTTDRPSFEVPDLSALAVTLFGGVGPLPEQ